MFVKVSVLKKRCGKCGKTKNINAFSWKNKAKGKRQWDCRSCHSEAFKKLWYRPNSSLRKAVYTSNDKRRAALLDWYHKSKIGKKCARCGESDIRCLDYHHSNPKEKEYTIADMVRLGMSKRRMEKEITKCVVLCANCHRKMTNEHLDVYNHMAALSV